METQFDICAFILGAVAVVMVPIPIIWGFIKRRTSFEKHRLARQKRLRRRIADR